MLHNTPSPWCIHSWHLTQWFTSIIQLNENVSFDRKIQFQALWLSMNKNNLISRYSTMNSSIRHFHGNRISINCIGIILIASIVLNLISRSHGNIYSFHKKPLLENSVSTRCSTNTCRSTLEAAAECSNISTCVAIAPEVRGGKQCMLCTCPADGTALHKNGIFYFRGVELFSKRE